VICIVVTHAERVRCHVTNFRWVLFVILCLGVTGGRAAWADPAHVDWVEDPYAPHVTRGTTARLGTAVGFLYGERADAIAFGATTAVGQRFGRLAIESELDYLTLQAKGGSNVTLGDAERLGVIARFDVLRLGPRWVGGNSLLALYVEGGAAVAWNHWSASAAPAADEAMRVVPSDTKRVEGQVGFGLALDHRLQEPIGFPHRIGWFLGWRLAMAPVAGDASVACRGVACRTVQTMTEDRATVHSMLFQSSLAVTW
jgi:hypothetical protein